MTLSDLKRFAVRRSVNVRFRIAEDLECVVTSQGIGRIPALKHLPTFHLERELAQVDEFVLEPAGEDPQRRRSRPREMRLRRPELESMVAGV
ncbi:MAG: hypothetical protein KIT09_35285 [Bryobacteraceae bacterium]|nr:hypothetical protein [Bryobacteraceae bacterium]